MSAATATVDRVSRTPREVARAGMVLGTLAFFFTLPPLQRSARCRSWSASSRSRAASGPSPAACAGMGWGAIAMGLIGIGLGILAMHSSNDHLTTVVSWGALIGSTLAWATPLAYAAVGGMFSERSGVVNIGLEGMMLSGAFFACLGADKFGSWEMGLVTAAVAGAGFALIHAFFAIHLRADQIVGGTAINFLALGVTGYFFIQVYGDNGTPGDLPRIPNLHISGFGKRSFFGQSIGDLNLMIWLSFVLLIVA